MPEHTVLSWNRATPELYAVVREETPPGFCLLLDNVVLTPPVGAGTLDALRAKTRLAFANMRRFPHGEPLPVRVPGT